MPQPYSPPISSAAFGIPLTGSSYSTWVTVGNGAGNSLTYTLTSGDIGKNLYFRATVYACDTMGSWQFKTKITGNDGTTDFSADSAAVGYSATDANDDITWYYGALNSTVMIATGADLSAGATNKIWTFTISLTSPTSLACLFYADLISYGSPSMSSAIGSNGEPGPAQDAWIPCCDSVQSSYQIATTSMADAYLEISATTVQGGFDKLKLTNAGSVIDQTLFPSATHAGSITAFSCPSDQPTCAIVSGYYFVELITHGYGYYDTGAKDFHATFTLTSKSSATATSTASPMASSTAVATSTTTGGSDSSTAAGTGGSLDDSAASPIAAVSLSLVGAALLLSILI